VILFLNVKEEYVPFDLHFEVQKSGEYNLNFRISCKQQVKEQQGKHHTKYNVDVGEFSNIDEMRMKDILIDSAIHRDLSSIYSINSLRRFEILITQVFLKRFFLVKVSTESSVSTNLRLKLEHSNPSILPPARIEIQGEQYSVVVVHNFFQYFRVFLYLESRPKD
jgi:hypothetical protein